MLTVYRGHNSSTLTEGYIIFLFTTFLVTDIGNILAAKPAWVARGVLLLLLMFSPSSPGP